MKSLDEILTETTQEIKNIYYGQQACEPKDNAAKEVKKKAKEAIEEIYRRDMSQPYKPELQYKEINLG